MFKVSPKRKLDANLQLYDTIDHVDKEGYLICILSYLT